MFLLITTLIDIYRMFLLLLFLTLSFLKDLYFFDILIFSSNCSFTDNSISSYFYEDLSKIFSYEVIYMKVT
jgi:hypothetical protein